MGVAYSVKLNKRIVLLEKTVLMIREMKVQLEYLNLPVYELVNEIESKKYLSDLSFLKECIIRIENNYDFPVAWELSIEESPLYYKRIEKDKLLHLGGNLGRSDIENQINMLNVQLTHFEEFLKSAKIQKQKYGNMSVTLALLSGCMIFIMII